MSCDKSYSQPDPDGSKSDLTFKVLVCGDGRVGKSSLMLQYCRGEFNPDSRITIGCDYSRRFLFVGTEDGPADKVQVQLWDLAGQDRYLSGLPLLFRGASAAIVVYGVDNRESFDHVDRWMTRIGECVPENADFPVTVIGNKMDLREAAVAGDETFVTFDAGTDMSKRLNVPFVETSARTGRNVDAALGYVVKELVAAERGVDVDDLQVMDPTQAERNRRRAGETDECAPVAGKETIRLEEPPKGEKRDKACKC